MLIPLLLLWVTPLVSGLIDRQAVVSRHIIHVFANDTSSLDFANDVFQVGNGAFAFGVDITSLQTFNESYTHLGVNTLSDWGFHTKPFSKEDPTYALRQFNFSFYPTPIDGKGSTRTVPYMNSDGSAPEVVSWMMDNPHRLNLGQTSLRVQDGITSTATLPIQLTSITNASQELNPWEGYVESNFTVSVGGSPPQCALTQDNFVAHFVCASGVITAFPFASYGQPLGACPASLQPNPVCHSSNASQVLAGLCVGKRSCTVLVNFESGWGDPCPGKAKYLAANFTCSAPPPPPSSPLSLSLSIRTLTDPDVDMVATRVQCTASDSGGGGGGGGGGGKACPLALRLAFPYGTTAGSGADWGNDALHTTTVVKNTSNTVTLLRTLDSDSYRVDCRWEVVGGAQQQQQQQQQQSLLLLPVPGLSHAFDLVAAPSGWPVGAPVSLTCLYTPVGEGGGLHFPVGASQPWMQAKIGLTEALLSGAVPLPNFPLVSTAAALAWEGFWQGGAFIDLSGGTGVNRSSVAFELERRVVLSRYLMRVNDAGAEPPQETGLLCNSWGGKDHKEMRWWHQAHWPLWGNPELLERSDGFFFDQLQNATSYAAFQGYRGAHWPKETGSVSNRSSPGGITVPWLGLDKLPWPFPGEPNGTLLAWESPQVANALVIWQQPHMIALSELQRRAANASSSSSFSGGGGGESAALAVMARLSPLVFATADYLADRMYYNETEGKWGLGPPVMGGQECGSPERTWNPPFEVVYIATALDTAAEWARVLGVPVNPAYARITSNLVALPTDPASPPGTPPLYVFDAQCVCQYLAGGVGNPACDPAWVPAGGSNCGAFRDHPLTLAFFGTWNGLREGKYGVSIPSANATLKAVWSNWESWGGAWGWDDAVIAQAMARMGWSPESILEGPLMDPKFPYYKSGQTLCCPTYLPGNGGLLLTIAMLAGGSENTPKGYFPADWGVVHEGFDVTYL